MLHQIYIDKACTMPLAAMVQVVTSLTFGGIALSVYITKPPQPHDVTLTLMNIFNNILGEC